MILEVLFVDLRNAQRRVDFAGILLQVSPQQLYRFQEIAISPFLFGNFIIRIGDSLAIIVVEDFEGLVAQVSGNIMGEQQPAANDGKNKHTSVKQEVGKVRLQRAGGP